LKPAQGKLVYYDATEEPDIAEKIRALLEAEKAPSRAISSHCRQHYKVYTV